MGQSSSKILLQELTKEEVGEILCNLGNQYKGYAELVVDNGLDGEFLASMTDTELEETLEDLEVNSRLHRRVLTKKFQKLLQQSEEILRRQNKSNLDNKSYNKSSHRLSSAPCPPPHDAVTVAGEGRKLIRKLSERRSFVENLEIPDDLDQQDFPGEQYNISPFTPSSELTAFDKIASEGLAKTSITTVYAGVHLIQRDGQVSLSSHERNKKTKNREPVRMERVHLPHDQTMCSRFVRQSDALFTKQVIEPRHQGPEVKAVLGPNVKPYYYGHVLLDETGRRVGAICMVNLQKEGDDSSSTTTTSSASSSSSSHCFGGMDREEIMREMAKLVQQQLLEYKALLGRKKSLQGQLKGQGLHGNDHVVMKEEEGPSAVMTESSTNTTMTESKSSMSSPPSSSSSHKRTTLSPPSTPTATTITTRTVTPPPTMTTPERRRSQESAASSLSSVPYSSKSSTTHHHHQHQHQQQQQYQGDDDDNNNDDDDDEEESPDLTTTRAPKRRQSSIVVGQRRIIEREEGSLDDNANNANNNSNRSRSFVQQTSFGDSQTQKRGSAGSLEYSATPVALSTNSVTPSRSNSICTSDDELWVGGRGGVVEPTDVIVSTTTATSASSFDDVSTLASKSVVAASGSDEAKEEEHSDEPPAPHLPDEIPMINSSRLPTFNNPQISATEKDMAHLGPDFFAPVEATGAPRPPIGKQDMERVAAVEELGLQNLNPTGPVAKSLKRLVEMAVRLLDMQIGEINFHNHESQFSMARHTETEEQKQIYASFCQRVNHDEHGETFLYKTYRSLGICNYTIYNKETFVIPDLAQDESFRWIAQVAGLRCYVGVPVVGPDGNVLAVLCLFDSKPRPDISRTQIIQGEQIAQMILQNIDNWKLRQDIEKLERERDLLANANQEKSGPPQDKATLVLTDIQGSTALWEADAIAMREAQNLHDQTIRKVANKFNGYEVTTEGDSFFLAFHDPVDAFNFALQAQVALQEANWSKNILRVQGAHVNETRCFRGLRVRMAVHSGPVKATTNEVSGRREYFGETTNIAKSIERMAHGGQILATFETWNIAAYLAESMMGSPQVIDLGGHVLQKGPKAFDGVIAKEIVQLVPAQLACDYFAMRRIPGGQIEGERADEPGSGEAPVQTGREFPPVLTMRQVSASFHDAPYLNNEVTIAFIDTREVEKHYEDAQTRLTSLSRFIGFLLAGTSGYHCKSNMLAFPSLAEGVEFGLRFFEELHQSDAKLIEGAPVAPRFLKYGCKHGIFDTMGAHATTGRADYFGRVVNRASRIAGVAELGTVCCGYTETEKHDFAAHGVVATAVGQRRLKGVKEEMTIYLCTNTKKTKN